MEFVLFWLNFAKDDLIWDYEQTWNKRNKANCNDVEIESIELHMHYSKLITLTFV